MMLRSSSTPVLGHLITPVADCESPNIIKHQPATVHHGLSRFSINHPGSIHFTSVSCNSSPAVSEFSTTDSHRGFRRAQSEGNLEGLVKATSSSYDDLYNCSAGLRREDRSRSSLLETIPSFSAFNLRDGFEEEVDTEDDIIEEDEEFEEWSCDEEVKLEAGAAASQYHNGVGVIDGIEYMCSNLGNAQDTQAISERMYLALGLGIDGGKFGGGNDSGRGGGGSGGGSGGRGCDMTPGNGENHNMEEYYKEMVGKNPGNSLFLRNYAQFLYQSKRDLARAEEYYCRAVLADPNDGEVLAQYATLTWELHHDRERALSYFQRAVQAASEDSFVNAAYASFLWETEENEEKESSSSSNGYELFPHVHNSMNSASASA